MGRRPKPIGPGRLDQSPGGRTRPSHQSPTGPSSGPMGTNAPGSVTDGPLYLTYPHPTRSPANETPPASPVFPAAPTTPGGSAPQDRAHAETPTPRIQINRRERIKCYSTWNSFPRPARRPQAPGRDPPSLTPSSPSDRAGLAIYEWQRNPGSPSWTLPSGPRAAAGSASRSRAASTR